MKSFYQYIDLTPTPGSEIGFACHETQQLANREQEPVRFTFNGVICIARPNGDAELLANRWSEKLATSKTVESL